MKKMAELCPMCKKHEAIIKTERAKTIINGIEVEYDETVYFCSYLGEDNEDAYFIPSKVMNENMQRARESYETRKTQNPNVEKEPVKNNEKLIEFLTELTNLTDKYGFGIGGCGCCGSPWVSSDGIDGGKCLEYDEEKGCYRVDIYDGYDYHEPIYVYGDKED